MEQRVIETEENARRLLSVGEIVREAARECRDAKATLVTCGIACDPETPHGSDPPYSIGPAIREVKALLKPSFPDIDATTPQGTDHPNVIPGEMMLIRTYVKQLKQRKAKEAR